MIDSVKTHNYIKKVDVKAKKDASFTAEFVVSSDVMTVDEEEKIFSFNSYFAFELAVDVNENKLNFIVNGADLIHVQLTGNYLEVDLSILQRWVQESMKAYFKTNGKYVLISGNGLSLDTLGKNAKVDVTNDGLLIYNAPEATTPENEIEKINAFLKFLS